MIARNMRLQRYPALAALMCSTLTVCCVAVGASEVSADIDGWDAVINASGKPASRVLDELYSVLAPVIAAPDAMAANRALPLRVRLTGTLHCRFEDATDFGRARACLALFASAPLRNKRPTPAARSLNLIPRGTFEVNLSGFRIVYSGAQQTEPVVLLMLGSGYFSGHESPTSVLQKGALAGIKLTGDPVLQMARRIEGVWNSRKVPTLFFGDPVHSSPTTAIGFWINNNPDADLSAFFLTVQGAGGDNDDLCFYAHNAYQVDLGGLRCFGASGPQFGPGTQTLVIRGGTFSPSGRDPFGIVLGSPRGPVIPVDTEACASGHCKERIFFGIGPVFGSQIVAQGYTTENLLVFTSYRAQLNVWVEGAPARGYGMLIGAGTCTSDGSICALDSDCPSSTCQSVPFPTIQMDLVGDFHETLALGPSARGPQDTLTLRGAYHGARPRVVVNKEANVSVDVTDLDSHDPVFWPPGFAGLLISERQRGTHMRAGQLGASPSGKRVIHKSTTSTLIDTEVADSIVTNEGATGPIVLRLPKARPGLCLTLYVVREHSVEVEPSKGDRIQRASSRESGGLISNGAVGSTLSLCAVSPGHWGVLARSGIWTDTD
jgi:hypothetical protein